MEDEPWGEDPDNSIKKYIDTHFKPNMRPRHILEDNSYCEYKKSKDNKFFSKIFFSFSSAEEIFSSTTSI